MYTEKKFNEAVKEGHLEAKRTFEIITVSEALNRLEKCILSPLQRLDGKVSNEEKESRYEHIYTLNEEYKNKQGMELPRFDVCVRTDLGGEIHKINGYHTETVILEALDFKAEDAETRKLKEQMCAFYTWTAHDGEGEEAIWNRTNDMARGISAAERMHASLTVRYSWFGDLVNPITDYAKVASKKGNDKVELNDEKKQFANLIKATTTRKGNTTTISRVLTCLAGCEQSVEEAQDMGAYYLGSFGADIKANTLNALAFLSKSDSQNPADGIISNFVKWGTQIQDKASFLLDMSWDGSECHQTIARNMVKAIAAVGACMRNPDLAQEALNAISNGILPIEGPNGLKLMWDTTLGKSIHYGGRSINFRHDCDGNNKKVSTFHAGVETYLLFFKAVVDAKEKGASV